MGASENTIVLKGVRVHNLKNIDLTLKSHELIVFTGVSGSGKSSLAFDTLFVEGQRRYIESLSIFARRYLDHLAKPDLDEVSGLSPTIAIEQKSAGKSPRSTVGTITEIYDYLRLLYARVGRPYCPVSGEPVSPQSKERIIKLIQTLPEGSSLFILSPHARNKKGEFKEDFALFLRKGYVRARVDDKIIQLNEEISLDKNLPHDIDLVIDRLAIHSGNHSRIAEAVVTALDFGKGMMSVLPVEGGEELFYSTHAYSPQSGLSYSSLEPHDFSFNSPTGMCLRCQGLGITQEFDLNKILDPKKSIAEDCCVIASSYQTVRYKNIYNNLATLFHFNVRTPWHLLPPEAKNIFLYGSPKKWLQMHFVHPTRPLAWTDYVQWRGVIPEALQRYTEAKSDNYRKKMAPLMHTGICSECQGARLRPYPAATRFEGVRLHELCKMDCQEALRFFESLCLEPKEEIIAQELISEIKRRLRFLIDVGLHYLSLDRSAPTLSGGEAQRVRLASQVGCGLVGVTFILDEPSIGLHPRDNQKLIATLKQLRDMGNTVIVVEHDEETIWAADRVVDFGPGAGKEGGYVLVNGSHKQLLAHPQSLTGAYLSGRQKISLPQKRRSAEQATLSILGACHNNLKHIDVNFPLGCFIAITGVSGSGKSSLISETLYPALARHLHGSELPIGAHERLRGLEHIDKVIAIDQTPIGRTPRSNPATYTKIFDEIRLLFSQLPESVARGFSPTRFSFNMRLGACPECHGLGLKRIDMDFLEDQWVTCQSCQSKRFDAETLSIFYKGKNIHDVLEMTASEASLFFANLPSLKRKLDLICRVGMDYISLGQSSTTLSGGEAQRLKLSKELVRPGTGRTFYILDEPTTGLHFHDINRLLSLLQELVERGNTVLVIEHSMDVVKTADWVIELGPEGGSQGGELLAAGTPEEVSRLTTPTAEALKHVLQKETKRKHMPRKQRHHDSGLTAEPISEISIQGAAQNNLKQLDLKIPRQKLTVFTGPAGSGKSSLAFETIYAEGQRRYIDSLSPYARQFVQQMPKPKISRIEGLSPAIAIEQKAAAGNPRSTIGTLTEIYDYLRLLFARAGKAYCPETGEEIRSITRDDVASRLLQEKEASCTILAPLELQKNEKFEELIARLARQGFLRLRLDQQIYALDEPIAFEKKQKQKLAVVIDRFKLCQQNARRLREALENAAQMGQGKILVVQAETERLFNLAFSVESTGRSYPEITPHTFSFNHSEGMCPDCLGLGFQYGAQLTENPHVMLLTLQQLLNLLWNIERPSFIDTFLQKANLPLHIPLNQLTADELHFILQGASEDNWMPFEKGRLRFRWLGLQPILAKAAKSGHNYIREPLLPLLHEMQCPSCLGARLNPLARHVRIQEETLPSLCCLPIGRLLDFLENLILPAETQELLEEVLVQLKQRLSFLVEVGLDYLSLDRRAPTLSNGEAQRIRLARQLGSQLTGILYVLDEPTIGLHPHDTARLNRALAKLQALGNTLLLVEHDPETIATADYLFDFGPGAGIHGGHITAQGTYQELLENPHSLTGAYLSGRDTLTLCKQPRTAQGYLLIESGAIYNLKNLHFLLPLGVLICLTGVSGSGKSTLMYEVIRPLVSSLLPSGKPFNKLIVIDQNPIGHTVRSDVGTYVELLTPLRTFYASLAGARTQGLQPRHFSYNHRQGMCSHCQGLGYKKIDRLFLPPVNVGCEECQGLRLNPLSLSVLYEGKNFGQLLQMTVVEAKAFFDFLPRVHRILELLIEVGLGYLQLGQEMASLSGGEAQRMKLSRELAQKGRAQSYTVAKEERTLYLLDEPTTGQHPDDIKKLLLILDKLVSQGHTMVVIEHHLDFIKNADYIIDLGPGAGEEGGEILCMGPPESLLEQSSSLTGMYLRKNNAENRIPSIS